MKFKGTKGDWFIGGYGGIGDSGLFIGSNATLEGCDCIATLAEKNYKYQGEAALEANAQIISAAPDLLKALQLIVNHSDPFRSAFEMHHNIDGEALFENAQKAIAKALGE